MTKKLFLLFVFISSPAFSESNSQELKIGISQEFETLPPLVSSMAATKYILRMAYRSPVVLNTAGHWTTQLIKEIPSRENKKVKSTKNKSMTAEMEILEKAQWGDGTPVTCADFKFALSVGKNENVSNPDRDTYNNISDITWNEKAPKKCTFHFVLAKWSFFRNMPDPLPQHLEENIYKQNASEKEAYERASNYAKNPTLPGLYNGPYVISELKLGSHVTLTPNPFYYGTTPAIKKIIFKLIPNTGSLESHLRSGSIDMISPLGFTFDQAVAFEKKVQTDSLPYQVLFKPGLTYEHIDLNLDHPILKDLRVRQALTYSLNREELVSSLFSGRQTAALHDMTPLDPAYTDDAKKISVYPFSRTKAAELLDAAGWKLEKDSYRYKDGKKLSLTLATTAGNKSRETVQAFLQNQWKALGIEILIKNEPARVFFGETMRKRNFSALAMYAWVSSPELSKRATLHSQSIPTAQNSWSGQNYPRWSNPKVDALIEKFELEFNPKKRAQISQQILKEYTTDIPVIPLYYRSEVAAIPANLSGFRLAAHLYYESSEVDTWSLQSLMK